MDQSAHTQSSNITRLGSSDAETSAPDVACVFAPSSAIRCLAEAHGRLAAALRQNGKVPSNHTARN